tara:strand:+ start:1700 stop:2815 length:1116 start_codon:yes stop_codon:yes gene_type:complete
MIKRISKPIFSKKTYLDIKNVLDSGNLVHGKFATIFEKKISKYLNIKYCSLVSSGTAALHLSLQALKIGKGDEVILPAYSYIATANVIEIVGAKPIFVDINIDDFCIDIEKIYEKITTKTKAIMPVHEFGMPSKINKICSIAKTNNLYVIEDAACALGAKYKDKHVGTFGKIGCFSLHPRKNITTGEGGIIVTNDKKIYNHVNSLKNHGIKFTNKNKVYAYPGYNYRITDIQATIGINQLRSLDSIISIRKKIALLYNKLLSEFKWIKIPNFDDTQVSVCQSYHIIISKDINLKDLSKFLKKNSIETGIGAQALPIQNYYSKKYKYKKLDYPNSYLAFKRGMVLPIGQHINLKDVINIYKVFKKYNDIKYG